MKWQVISFLAILKSAQKKKKKYKWNECVPTQSRVGDSIHLQDEVVFKENVADDGEQVDQDESQHCCEHDGASITGYTLYYIQQRLLSVYQVEQLQKTKRVRCAAIFTSKREQDLLGIQKWEKKTHSGISCKN